MDNSKWYKVKKLKPDVAALLAKTSEESDFTVRESIFEQHREELQVQIRLESKLIKQVRAPPSQS